MQGNVRAFTRLLNCDPNVNAKDEDGRTPLMRAAEACSASVVKVLVDKGADVNAQGKYGVTALMFTSFSNYAEVVKLLLDAGADITAKTKEGWTALRWAVPGRVGVQELLKAHGAKE
jgi:ankyrin repeat protein